MNTDGFWLIRLTIWLAVSAWLLRVIIEVSHREFAGRDRLIRTTWLMVALACVAHVIAAMGIGHCWSLANAMRHTAMVTRQVIGIEVPWSVFVNFTFTAYWLFDAFREFRTSQLRNLGRTRHAIWIMMMVNGTIVFGPSYWTWLSIPVVLAIGLAWISARNVPTISDMR